jgi:hypothetical protein
LIVGDRHVVQPAQGLAEPDHRVGARARIRDQRDERSIRDERAHDRAPLGVGVHDARRDAGRGRALLDLDLAPPGVERLLLRGDLQHEGLAAGVDLVHAGAGQAGGDARDGRRRAAERSGQTVGELHSATVPSSASRRRPVCSRPWTSSYQRLGPLRDQE